MQLIVRGEQTHVLDVAPTANVQALRAQLSLLEVGVPSESLDLNCSHSQQWIFLNLFFLPKLWAYLQLFISRELMQSS